MAQNEQRKNRAAKILMEIKSMSKTTDLISVSIVWGEHSMSAINCRRAHKSIAINVCFDFKVFFFVNGFASLNISIHLPHNGPSRQLERSFQFRTNDCGLLPFYVKKYTAITTTTTTTTTLYSIRCALNTQSMRFIFASQFQIESIEIEFILHSHRCRERARKW